jgi:integrin-linked kinase-associated serine/threonine phosphatase 2C
MEDQHVTAKSEKQPIHFFGVYDGHGGTKCAEYLRDKLHTIVLENDEVRTNPQQVLREGIAKVEKEFTEFSRESKDCSGSTAAVALVVNGDTLVTANVGDSEIVLCRGGQPVVLTTRHVPSNQGEESRILAAGGRMFRHRVGHPKFNPEFVSLGVSRAIGDIGFKLDEYTDGKQSGVIADADTRLTRLTPEDSFLIMACDGLWDVCSYADVVKSCTDLLAQGKAGQEITDALVADALLKGSTDNVTCMFIGLSHTLPAPPPPKA